MMGILFVAFAFDEYGEQQRSHEASLLTTRLQKR
jgi:hypothetical protein